jgi:hypothetical protein
MAEANMVLESAVSTQEPGSADSRTVNTFTLRTAKVNQPIRQMGYTMERPRMEKKRIGMPAQSRMTWLTLSPGEKIFR